MSSLALQKSKYYHRLYEWKQTVCPECEFKDNCEGLMAQVKVCYGEDVEDTPDPVDALLKRVIRRMCAIERRGRRDEQADHKSKGMSKWRKVWSSYATRTSVPVEHKATLLCSDLEEYDTCQRLMSG